MKIAFSNDFITLERKSGGGSGIRTHGDIAASPVFKTGALNRSAIPPASVSSAFPACLGRKICRCSRLLPNAGCVPGFNALPIAASTCSAARSLRRNLKVRLAIVIVRCDDFLSPAIEKGAGGCQRTSCFRPDLRERRRTWPLLTSIPVRWRTWRKNMRALAGRGYGRFRLRPRSGPFVPSPQTMPARIGNSPISSPVRPSFMATR